MVCYECSAVQNERQAPHASWCVLCLVQELVCDPAHLQVALGTWDFRGTDWEKAWKIWSIQCWVKPVHLLAHTDGGLGLCPFHICFEHALGFEGSSGGWFAGLRLSPGHGSTSVCAQWWTAPATWARLARKAWCDVGWQGQGLSVQFLGVLALLVQGSGLRRSLQVPHRCLRGPSCMGCGLPHARNVTATTRV